MKRLGLFILLALLVGVLFIQACGSDDDSGDGDNTTLDGDSTDGDSTEGDATDGDTTGEAKSCTPDWTGMGFGGMSKTGCDTKVGVCENAVNDGEFAYFPCLEDPDCCCSTENPIDEAGGIYRCEFDSCVEDSFCDVQCNDDPDC